MRWRTVQLLKCNKRLLLFFSWELFSIYFSCFFKCFTLFSGLFVDYFFIIRNWLKLENKKADCGHHIAWWKSWWNQIKISLIGRFFENTSSEAHITSLHYYTVFLLYISFCFKQTISPKWGTNLADQLKAIDNIWITLWKFLKSPMHFSLYMF